MEDFGGMLGAGGPDIVSQIGGGGSLKLQRDRQSLTWSRVSLSASSAVPPPRSGAASVVVKGRLYMFGVSNFWISLDLYVFQK